MTRKRYEAKVDRNTLRRFAQGVGGARYDLGFEPSKEFSNAVHNVRSRTNSLGSLERIKHPEGKWDPYVDETFVFVPHKKDGA